MGLKYNLAGAWLLRDRSPLPITTLEVIKDSPEFVTLASSKNLERSIFFYLFIFFPCGMHRKGQVMYRHTSWIKCRFIVKDTQCFSYVTIYCERSVTVTLSRTVFINRNLFTSSILFIWLILATLYFSSSTSCWVSLMAYSTSAAPLLSFQIVGYCLAFLPKEPFLFFNRQSLLICGHLLLILSCLIRDLGGNSRSSGCEDDKWIARLEKMDPNSSSPGICVHIHALFFFKDNGWHGGDFKGATQNSNK